LPVMVEITAWSARHDALTNAPKEFLSQYDSDKAVLTKTLQTEMDKGNS